ncbi:hypothetical protein [Streptomyces sp. NPDC004296]
MWSLARNQKAAGEYGTPTSGGNTSALMTAIAQQFRRPVGFGVSILTT